MKQSDKAKKAIGKDIIKDFEEAAQPAEPVEHSDSKDGSFDDDDEDADDDHDRDREAYVGLGVVGLLDAAPGRRLGDEHAVALGALDLGVEHVLTDAVAGATLRALHVDAPVGARARGAPGSASRLGAGRAGACAAALAVVAVAAGGGGAASGHGILPW